MLSVNYNYFGLNAFTLKVDLYDSRLSGAACHIEFFKSKVGKVGILVAFIRECRSVMYLRDTRLLRHRNQRITHWVLTWARPWLKTFSNRTNVPDKFVIELQ